MNDTLLLDLDNWDLVLDLSGNIALANAPYSLAQDVASAIKLFQAELWYDAAQGVPYATQILGQTPPISLLKQYLVNAALTVSGVVSAQCIIQSFAGRNIVGKVIFIDTNGQTNHVSL